jgi:phage/plasmid-like protein (TIGR03299 family)
MTASNIILRAFDDDAGWSRSGFFVGEDEGITSADAIKKAGLNWNVETRDLYYSTGEGSVKKDDKFKAVVRTVDNSRLGVVKSGYTPIQNAEAFSFMDTLVDEGLMKYHSAGSWGNGQRVWLLGKISETEIVPQDILEKYILLFNSHNGSSSLKAVLTSLRIVCTNAVILALEKGENTGIHVRHTRNAKDHLATARDVFKLMSTQSDKMTNIARKLAQLRVTDQDFEHLTLRLVPNPPPEVSARYAEKKREQLTDLFHNGKGHNIPGVAGTGWAALNAVTEYTNHMRGTRGGEAAIKRLESTLFGPSAKMVRQSAKMLLQMTA